MPPSPKDLLQGYRHFRSWRFTFYGILLSRDHRVYVVVSTKKIPRPHKYLQWTANMPDQQVQDGCTEEGGSLHLLGAWYPTKSGCNNIPLLDTATTRADCAGTRGLGKLRQSRNS